MSLENQIIEMKKSYFIALAYDKALANQIKTELDRLRLTIALDAESKEIFYEQINFAPTSAGGIRNFWYSKDDTAYMLRRGVSKFNRNVTISLTNNSKRNKIYTREAVANQQLFSNVQGALTGQQTTFDFLSDLNFNINEALGIGVTGQTNGIGYLFLHGATKNEKFDVNLQNNSVALGGIPSITDLQREIAGTLPEFQLVPLLFQFTGGANTYAKNPTGGDKILSTKSDRTTILTHISTTAPNCLLTLIDEAKNQTVASRIEMQGIAGLSDNPYETFYPLPSPHLLKAGSRLRVEVLNGSVMNAAAESQNVLKYLTLKGFSL